MLQRGKKGVKINLELNSEAIFFHSLWGGKKKIVSEIKLFPHCFKYQVLTILGEVVIKTSEIQNLFLQYPSNSYFSASESSSKWDKTHKFLFLFNYSN
jgi:hypothetical protein